ncbi:hypothetical protein QVD17_23764 [Tagetes erecta]|uniref:Uncharacterized protein n=1 Tax=Tagetes erecta TaxID=13708 RepID=A0AAD8KHF6_TARER|nr:hypothetical protein QVD17_23764 [Tagetes erecta]
MQQVIIGLDTTKMISKMESISQAEFVVDRDEIKDDDSGTDNHAKYDEEDECGSNEMDICIALFKTGNTGLVATSRRLCKDVDQVFFPLGRFCQIAGTSKP